jgi:hypothetical protein
LPVRRVQPGSMAGCRKFSAPSHTSINIGGGQQAQGQTTLPNWAEFLPPPPEHPPPSTAGSDTNPSSRLLVPVSVKGEFMCGSWYFLSLIRFKNYSKMYISLVCDAWKKCKNVSRW